MSSFLPSATMKRNAFEDLLQNASSKSNGVNETNKKLRIGAAKTSTAAFHPYSYKEIAYAVFPPFESDKEKVHRKDGTWREREVYRVRWYVPSAIGTPMFNVFHLSLF
jgi:hypothetical protein